MPYASLHRSASARPTGAPGRTLRRRAATSSVAAILAATLAGFGAPPPAAAVVAVLYAATGAGDANASLYTVDPSTGATTLVAPILIGSTPVQRLGGLAFDPTDGTLYGFSNGGTYGDPTFGDGTLLVIDKATGAATIVGSAGAGAIQVADMAFDPLGNLYAWTGGCGDSDCNVDGSDLHLLDTTTGTSSKVVESGTYGFATGLAFDAAGRLWMKSYETVFRVDQSTGEVFGAVGNSSLYVTRAALAFGPGDVAYTTTYSGTANLLTMSTTTGALTTIGSMGISSVSSLAWDRGVVTPTVADLSITASVDDPAPTAGDEVVFTIQLANAGPDAAAGVEVRDRLPSGFTFVSADTNGTGTYDDTTGTWTVGSLAAAGTATLELTGTVLATGVHLDAAEVVAASTYDPDSTPGAHAGDAYDTVRSAPAGAPILYAATGAADGRWCHGGPSTLLELDPATGAATAIAPITIGGERTLAVTGLAVHPTSGVLYGFMSGQHQTCEVWVGTNGTLLTIDPATGFATIVGTEGGVGIRSPDIAFDPFGTLYGWSVNDGDLATIDLATGVATRVGEFGTTTSGVGLASDAAGRLWVKYQTYAIARVDQYTGARFAAIGLTPTGSQNMLAFGPGGQLLTGVRRAGAAGYDFTLRSVNTTTGTVTAIGTNAYFGISALAWDLGTITPPALADLSIDITVDDATPDDWGQQVTYTITVSNAGPSAATGVKVRAQLPAGLVRVGDDAGGAYDPFTGIWTVPGSIASGGTAVLSLWAAVQPVGPWTTTAAIADTATYDPDSVPGSSTPGDGSDSQALAPTAVAGLDLAATVDVNGPTRADARSKGFTVVVTNVGTSPVELVAGNVAVTVNGSSATVSCGSFAKSLAPGKYVKVRCTWSPVQYGGIVPGAGITYRAVVTVAGDGYSTNDTGTYVVTAT